MKENGQSPATSLPWWLPHTPSEPPQWLGFLLHLSLEGPHILLSQAQGFNYQAARWQPGARWQQNTGVPLPPPRTQPPSQGSNITLQASSSEVLPPGLIEVLPLGFMHSLPPRKAPVV